jgi:hypothetical protein
LKRSTLDHLLVALVASDRHSHVVRMLHWSATQRLKRSTLDHLLVALVASDRHTRCALVPLVCCYSALEKEYIRPSTGGSGGKR